MDPHTLFHKRLRQYESIIPNLRRYMSQNPHVTMEMVLQDIQNNPSKKHEWEFDYLCQVIPVDILLHHGFVPKRPDLISSCLVNLTIDTLKRTKDTIPWNWSDLARHKDIKIADIAKHTDLPWSSINGYGISNNPNITHQDILDYPHLFTDYYRSVAYTNLGITVSFEELQKHPDKPWTYRILANSNINTLEKVKYILHTFFYEAHHDIKTMQMYVAMNPCLNLRDLIELLGTDVIYYAPYKSNVTLEELQSFPEALWKKHVHLMSHRVPLDYIMEHPEILWDWPKIISAHKDIPYDTYSKLKSFITEFIKQNHHYIPSEYNLKTMYFHNYYLSHLDKKRVFEDLLQMATEPPDDSIGVKFQCDFIINSPLFLEPTFQEIKDYFAKKKIIRHLVEALSNPAYQQCRKRLAREYNTMQF